MNRIKQVKNSYSKVLRDIQLQKQELLANIPDKSMATSVPHFKKHHLAQD